jgi:DNA-binding MarR family transcriptional regulator
MEESELSGGSLRPASQREQAAALATLRLLDAFETQAGVTQRSVAADLGIAVGLVNAYIKRCVRKGYVKASKAPARRYAYYLTPKGFAEKSRLTAEYLTSSFNFFRSARGQCGEVFEDCVARGYRRLVLCGVGELCEVAFLASTEFDVKLVGIYDPKFDRSTFRGLAVAQRFQEFGEVDAAIITAMPNAQAAADEMQAYLPAERVLAPRMLRVGRELAKTT